MKFIFLVDSTEQCAKSQGGLIFIKLKLVNESEVTDENGKNYSLSHLIIYEDKNKENGVYQKFLSLKKEIERLKSSSLNYEDLQEKATVDLKIASEMLDLESDEEEKEEFKKSSKDLVFKTYELCDFEEFAKKLSEGKLSIGSGKPYVEDMVGENCCLLKEGDNEIEFEPFLSDEFLTKLPSVDQRLEPEPKKEAKDYLTVFRDYSISASSPASSDNESEDCYYSPSSEIETAEKTETIEDKYSIIGEETLVTREEETIEDSVSKEEKSELTDTEAEIKIFSPVNSTTEEETDYSLATEKNYFAWLENKVAENEKIIKSHRRLVFDRQFDGECIDDIKIDNILGCDWKKELQKKIESSQSESDIDELIKSWKEKISQAGKNQPPVDELIFEHTSDFDYHEAEAPWPTLPISETSQSSYQELNDFNSENRERPPTPPAHKIDWNFWGPVIVAIVIVVIFVIGWLNLRKKEEKTFSD